MIVVTVELHSAITHQTTLLHKIIVSNDGSGSDTVSNYEVRVGRKGVAELPIVFTNPLRYGEVRDYPRRRLHVLNLIARALNAAGYR